MTKEQLINYIKGDSSDREREEVLEWIGRDPQNLKYFTELKDLWIYANLPDSKANKRELETAQAIMRIQELPLKLIKRERFRKYFSYAAAAAILLLISNIWLFREFNIEREKNRDKRIALTDVHPDHIHTLYTNNGVKGFTELPDGSKVWLNSASKLVYPDNFTGTTREVYISGEALFDVAKDSLSPMIVSTNRNFKVEVVGTKFNIRSYDNDDEAQTTLISGAINLIRESKTGKREIIAKLGPRESYVFSDINRPLLIKQADTTKQIAWKNGLLFFDSTPMTEVIKRLERWHGTQFIIEDPTVLKAKLTARFRSESIVQIMEMIKYCTSINYTVTENRVTIHKNS